MAKRSYSKESIKEMNQRCYKKIVDTTSVFMKPIPETDECGVMDPRFYKKIKSLSVLSKIVPDQYLKLSPNKSVIEGLKKGFDLKKSKSLTCENGKVDQISIRGKDNNLLPMRIYHPINEEKKSPILYYMHGGGFFSGNSDVCDDFLRYIAENYNILVFSLDYRLAPKYPYPKGHEDCYEGLKWIAEHGEHYQGDVNSLFVAGDSAGGNCAHYCVIRDIEEGKFTIQGQCLLYPVLNLSDSEDESLKWNINKYDVSKKHESAIHASIQIIKNGGLDIMNSVLDTETNTMYLSPAQYECKALPPTLIIVGEFDYLTVQCIAYASKHANTEVIIYKGMGHGFVDSLGYYPQSEDSAMEIGNFVLQHAHRIAMKPRRVLSDEERMQVYKDDLTIKRKYKLTLLTAINKKSTIEILDGNPVIVKPLLEGTLKNKIERHVASDIKAQEFFIHMATELFLNLNIDHKLFDEVRKFFNEVKSLPIASSKIQVKDISINGVDNNAIPMKVYYPQAKSTKLPIFYFIHGGGFIGGSSSVVDQFVKYIVEKFDVLGFSIDYRLAPTYEFPKGHLDCYSGLEWIHQTAHLMGGDIDNIFVSGDSAGGNLAHYCVTRSLNENGPKIKGQMLLYPTVDMAEVVDDVLAHQNECFEVDHSDHKEIDGSLNSFRKYLNEFMRKALQSDALNEELSPYISVRRDLPPTFLAVGEYDFLKIECLAYMAKLNNGGVATRTVLYNGFSHGFIDSMGQFAQCEDAALEVGMFLKSVMEGNYKTDTTRKS